MNLEYNAMKIFRKRLIDTLHMKKTKSLSLRARSAFWLVVLVVAFALVWRLEAWAMGDINQGGGTLNAGLSGAYFANADLTGSPAFTRKDVRVDFDWGTIGKPGGSIDPTYANVGPNNWSVQWTGQIMARFSETYTFTTVSAGGVRLFIRPAGTSSWTTLIDHWDTHPRSSDDATFDMTAHTPYDVKLEYKKTIGDAALALRWSSASTPQEVIDTTIQTGINTFDPGAMFADIVKGSRNSWYRGSGNSNAVQDSDGWPMEDAQGIIQEGINVGLDIDPLMRGRVAFSFRGSADVIAFGNVDQTYGQSGVAGPSGTGNPIYDAATNTTRGTLMMKPAHWNASYFSFTNSHRDGKPDGPAGITQLKLMRPIAPDALTSYPETTLFTNHYRDAAGHFTLLRFQIIAGLERDWSERTRPMYFNQSNGSQSDNKLFWPDGTTPIATEKMNNGPSIEYKIMLCNETGRDMMLSVPVLASDDYVRNLALAIKYGTDGVNPYTSPQANPVYPPLNPNLHVYIEIGNELWNYVNPYWFDWMNVNALAAGHLDAQDADGRIINYDHLPIEHANPNTSGPYYVNMYIWRWRAIMLRIIQHSNTFRSVFGDAAMMTRIRPVYEWQYTNAQGSADYALTFADDYFNNADGTEHVANPHPVNYYLWGGGGATYYGAVNSEGISPLMPDPTFNQTPVQAGYNPAPIGSAWTFSPPSDESSTAAGIYRVSDPAHPDAGIPAPYTGNATLPWNTNMTYGPQMGYITDKGVITATFTAPSTQVSSVYSLAFRALNRGSDTLAVRVILDRGTPQETDISTGDYTFLGYNASEPWKSKPFHWFLPLADYYVTKTFTAQPGSQHTISLVGKGDSDTSANRTNLRAFIGEMRIASADAIFASGMPGGGEATGQPSGQVFMQVLNNMVDWAGAYGLHMLSYEGGWSLGGDTGGSPLQIVVKYSDPRAKAVQALTIDMFHWAGAAINVLGTYLQWPSWGETYAQQGLLDLGAAPIVQGIDDRQNAVRAEARNGSLVPGILFIPNIHLKNSITSNTGQWQCGSYCVITWNMLVPRTAPYTITLPASAGATSVELTVDGDTTIVNGSAVSGVSGTVSLTAGLHNVRLQSKASEPFVLHPLTVRAVGPAAPILYAVSFDGSGNPRLQWNVVSGATGYQVRVSEVSGVYSHATDVGNATSYSPPWLKADTAYYFTVTATNASGISMPSNEVSTIIHSSSRPGQLFRWNFDTYGNNTTFVPAKSPLLVTSPAVTVSDLQKGDGLTGYSDVPWLGSLDLRPRVFHISQTAAEALANHEYVDFSLTPVPGKQLALSGLHMAWMANQDMCADMRFSTDGGVTYESFAVTCTPVSQVQQNFTIPLSGISALQTVTGPVLIRMIFYKITVWNGWNFVAPGGGVSLSLNGSYRNAGSALATTTTISSSVNPSDHAQGVAFAAAVQPPGSAGTVTFREGGHVRGTANVANDLAMLRLATLPPGSHTLNATYEGDATHLPSTSAPLSQSVRPENCSNAQTRLISIGRKGIVPVFVTESTLLDCAVLNQSTLYLMFTPAQMTTQILDAAFARASDGRPAKYYIYRYSDKNASGEKAHAGSSVFIERYPGTFAASDAALNDPADPTLGQSLRTFATTNGITWQKTDGSNGSMMLEADQLYLIIVVEQGGVRMGI